MNFDTHLTSIVARLQHLRQLDPETDRQCADQETLEVLRAMTQYRGLIKNVTEMQAAGLIHPLHR